MVYTSGSTGRPKGVAVPHRTLRHLLSWQLRATGAEVASGATLRFASPSFDVSLQETLLTWAGGGTLVLPARGARRDVERLVRELETQRIERLFLPYVALQHLADQLDRAGEAAPLPALREVVTAGERLQVTPAIRGLFGRMRGRCTLRNQYGPSEAHVVTEHVLGACGTDRWPDLPPIGRPVAGARVHVVDRALLPVPAGVAGEIVLGGPAVGLGYPHRPRGTAERFVPDPFGSARGARLYRTGDLAKALPGGEVDFLGRIDHQVKLRGYRIEPGEIESVLRRHPGVRDAAVSVVATGSDDARLAAFLVPADDPVGEDLCKISSLRAFLKSKVPAYMVPSQFVTLDALPLTPTGKVDRRALPAPGAPEDRPVSPAGSFRSPVEEIVAGIWSELLRVDSIGPYDDFFALGGHSLVATRLMARVRRSFGVEIPLRRLFETPTVQGLARGVEQALRRGAGLELPPLAPVGRDEPLPLSFTQERLWFLDRLEPGSAAYHIPSIDRLSGRLDPAALARAVRRLVERHEVLRARFVEGTDRQPVVVVDPPSAPALPVVDLSGLGEGPRRLEARRVATVEVSRPFDLARDAMLRTLLVRFDRDEHALVSVVHHIASDGWSMAILGRELETAYRIESGAEPSGAPAPPAFPELPIQYADYAVWQRRWLSDAIVGEEVAYWREALGEDHDVLALPTDRPRPPIQSRRGSTITLALGPEQATGVRAFARSQAATPFMVLLAAFGALLGRMAGQSRVRVGTPVAGRTRLEAEGVVGPFVNTQVLGVDLCGKPAFRALVSRVRDTVLGAQAHQEVPFERLVEELAPERSLAYSPLFQVMLTWQAADPGVQRTAADALRTETMEVATGTAKFDLTLSLHDRGAAGMSGRLEYCVDLFDRTTVDRLARQWRRLVAAALAAPRRPVAALPLLGPAERHQLVVEWPAIGAPPAAGAKVPATIDRLSGGGPVYVLDVLGEPVPIGVFGELWREAADTADEDRDGPGRLAATGELVRRRADGTLERRPRPVPKPTDTAVPDAPVAPRDALELRLTELWSEVLDVESIGVRDSFFALGGHSLLAFRVVTRIEELTGRRLPLATIFQAPTIERLASRLREAEGEPEGSLVVLRPDGERRALVFVHAAGGHVIPYVELTRRLAPGRPVYAFQAAEPDGREPVSVAGLARRYLAELRAFGVAGTPILAGWSFGGAVAFEMARQVVADGGEPPPVLLLDTRWPGGRDGAPAELDLLLELARDLGIRGRAGDVEAVRDLALEAALERLAERGQAQGTLPPDVGADTLGRLFAMLKARRGALHDWTPGAYPGPITMICAEATFDELPDPAAPWRDVVAAGVRAVPVPGDHYTMVREPHAGALAGVLDALAAETDGCEEGFTS